MAAGPPIGFEHECSFHGHQFPTTAMECVEEGRSFLSADYHTLKVWSRDFFDVNRIDVNYDTTVTLTDLSQRTPMREYYKAVCYNRQQKLIFAATQRQVLKVRKEAGRIDKATFFCRKLF